MLRLDPQFPLLWRDVHTVQFGTADSAPRLTPVPWQERLLHELRRGITETGVPVWAEMSGVHRRHVDDLLAFLGPLLLRERREEHLPPPPRVIVDATDAPPTLARVVCASLEIAGWSVHDATSAEPDTSELAVIVCAHAVGPWRTHPHLFDDRPYLPVVAAAGTINVGPLVFPGSSACTGCHDLRRRDEDALWPTLAAQLLAAPPMETSVAQACEAGAIIARLLGSTAAWSLGVPQVLAGQAWTLHPAVRGASTITTEHVTAHPECGCGAFTAVPLRERTTTRRRSSAPGHLTPPIDRKGDDVAASA